jgi:hypothetical protein
LSVVEILRTLIASYLIATLGATALAKLKNRRVASAGLVRERVVPASAAPAIVVMVAMVEFSLATLLTFGTEPAMTGGATAALFVVFAGYRLTVAVRTKMLTCSCAGAIRSSPASPPAVAGATLACLILAALACLLVFLDRPAGYPVNLLAVAAWSVPLASFIRGAWQAPRGSRTDDRYPAEYFTLASAEMHLLASHSGQSAPKG